MTKARLGILLVAVVLGSVVLIAFSRSPFSAVRNIKHESTDLSLVDLEVIATQGSGHESRAIEPKSSLQLRLEHAYVVTVSEDGGAGSIVNLMIDWTTLRPAYLLMTGEARSENGIAARVEPDAYTQRAIHISIQSSMRETDPAKTSGLTEECRGESLGDGLFRFESNPSSFCRLGSLRLGTNYVARRADSSYIPINCERSRSINCHAYVPIDSFRVKISFGEKNLSRWQQVIDTSISFLQSKKYQ